MPFEPTLPTNVCAARSTRLASSAAGRPASASRSPISARRRGPIPASARRRCYGDDVRVFDVAEGWAWIQAERDGYVGYVADAALADRAGMPTHVVSTPRTFVYPGPDLKLPKTGELSMGSRVAVTGSAETRGTAYALLASGEAMIARHLATAGTAPPATMSRSPRR